MHRVGLQGARRGRRFLTTRPDRSGGRPPDRVSRDFAAAAHPTVTTGAGGRHRGVLRRDLPQPTTRVRQRITDRRVLALIKAFLKAGIFNTETGLGESQAGIPQGGILSPLLVNIALSVLDEHFQVGGTRTGMETRQARDYGPRPTVRRRSAVGRGGRGVAAYGFAPIGGQDPNHPNKRWVRLPRLAHPSVALRK